MGRPDPQPRSEPDHDPLDQTQIQLSDIPQSEDHSQIVMVNINDSVSQTSHAPISTVQVLAITSLTLRVVTWLCLLASLIIVASNTTTYRIDSLYYFIELKFGITNFYSYQYMMSTIVIGFAYISLQVPFEIYQLATGKSLTTGNILPMTIFYGDKFLLCFLATGVGAAFGATIDLKKKVDQLDDFYESNYDETAFAGIRSKLDDFFNLAYVSAAFLLIAFLSSLASSILSSLALKKIK